MLDGAVRLFKSSAARPLLAANREAVRFEAALTMLVSLPHGHGTNRAEAVWESFAGGKPSWLVLYDAPGADRTEGEHSVFGDLMHCG